MAEKPGAESASEETPPADFEPGSEPSPIIPTASFKSEEPDEPIPSPSDLPAGGGKDTAAGDGPRPWLPLSLALLGLFVSLGGNVWMVWNTWETRRRYRQLSEHSALSSA